MVCVETGEGGLPRAALRTAAGEAHVYLHGAHVTHWQPRGGAPVLFMSAHARFAPDAAIRGGVPVIFPWFGPRAGDPRSPGHGFARRRPWRLERESGQDVVLALEADASTRATWPHDFALRLHVALDTALTMTLASLVVVTWIETGRRSSRRTSSAVARGRWAGQAVVVIFESSPSFQPWAV